jgi:hypothetical protein
MMAALTEMGALLRRRFLALVTGPQVFERLIGLGKISLPVPAGSRIRCCQA